MKRLLGLVALLVFLVGCASSQSTAGERAWGPAVGFRTEAHLREHFEKHGREFRVQTAAEYLKIAQTIRDAKLGPDLREGVRRDRVITRYQRSSGSFIAFDPNGIIRTLFKPSDGERYFERQLNR